MAKFPILKYGVPETEDDVVMRKLKVPQRRTNKSMDGMSLLKKAASVKAGVESGLQGFGRKLRDKALERQKQSETRLKKYYKDTGNYPG